MCEREGEREIGFVSPNNYRTGIVGGTGVTNFRIRKFSDFSNRINNFFALNS